MDLKCPECGGEMSFQGYRPLFPKCTSCEKNFHVDDCVREE
ncbi:hypothetical protein HBNXNv_0436 [Candidatus Nanohalovita haloferacivicina]|nr:hypothetical protein HBNXNv_0436 [Candidatus Nanohalobia archaeon BNXNv]